MSSKKIHDPIQIVSNQVEEKNINNNNYIHLTGSVKNEMYISKGESLLVYNGNTDNIQINHLSTQYHLTEKITSDFITPNRYIEKYPILYYECMRSSYNEQLAWTYFTQFLYDLAQEELVATELMNTEIHNCFITHPVRRTIFYKYDNTNIKELNWSKFNSRLSKLNIGGKYTEIMAQTILSEFATEYPVTSESIKLFVAEKLSHIDPKQYAIITSEEVLLWLKGKQELSCTNIPKIL